MLARGAQPIAMGGTSYPSRERRSSVVVTCGFAFESSLIGKFLHFDVVYARGRWPDSRPGQELLDGVVRPFGFDHHGSVVQVSGVDRDAQCATFRPGARPETDALDASTRPDPRSAHHLEIFFHRRLSSRRSSASFWGTSSHG